MPLVEVENEVGQNVEQREEQEKQERSRERFSLVQFWKAVVSLPVLFPDGKKKDDAEDGDDGLVYEIIYQHNVVIYRRLSKEAGDEGSKYETDQPRPCDNFSNASCTQAPSLHRKDDKHDFVEEYEKKCVEEYGHGSRLDHLEVGVMLVVPEID